MGLELTAGLVKPKRPENIFLYTLGAASDIMVCAYAYYGALKQEVVDPDIERLLISHTVRLQS